MPARTNVRPAQRPWPTALLTTLFTALFAMTLAACSAAPSAPVVTPPATISRYALSAANGQSLPVLEESFFDSTMAGGRTVNVRITAGELVLDPSTGRYTVAIERRMYRVDTVGGAPVESYLQTATTRDRGVITYGSGGAASVLASDLYAGLFHPLQLTTGAASAQFREPGTDVIVSAEFLPKA